MFWSINRFLGLIALTVAVGAALVLVLPRATRWRGRARTTALVAGLAAWALAPFWAISDGMERLHQYRDPTYAHVGYEAYRAAWMRLDNPIERVVFPAVRVARVWREPSHCPAGDPGGREPYADWRADVRLYTYFGLPGPLVRVTCGGWAW